MRALLLGSWLAIVLGACTTTASSPGVERDLTNADSAAPIRAAAGQVFVIRLAANPSTGYGWSWDEKAAAGILVQEGEPTMSGMDPQRVGGGGVQTWRFRAAKSGAGELVLTYRRPWEEAPPPAQTVRWQIQVQ